MSKLRCALHTGEISTLSLSLRTMKINLQDAKRNFGPISKIKSWLTNHTQSVVLENTELSTIHASSGTPQGTVLGSTLINDLSDSISHSTLKVNCNGKFLLPK